MYGFKMVNVLLLKNDEYQKGIPIDFGRYIRRQVSLLPSITKCRQNARLRVIRGFTNRLGDRDANLDHSIPAEDIVASGA